MKRVYVNEQWCLGCHLCEYYCAFAGTNERDMARALKGITINPNIRIEEYGNVSFAVS
ncbi:MAG: 4Fe-4S ferredoxin, partial [Oscillospiraceae bacterium]|nr:4Fe-4S ferredoxin [Oscillospiraceae bacterium]